MELVKLTPSGLAKRAQTAVKAEQARQKIQAAQTTLNQLESH